MGRDADRILSPEGIEELRQKMGLAEVIEEFRTDFDSDGDEGFDTMDSTGDTGFVMEEESGLDYPWPITLESVTFKRADDGTATADAVISFPDVPGASGYEVRIVPV